MPIKFSPYQLFRPLHGSLSNMFRVFLLFFLLRVFEKANFKVLSSRAFFFCLYHHPSPYTLNGLVNSLKEIPFDIGTSARLLTWPAAKMSLTILFRTPGRRPCENSGASIGLKSPFEDHMRPESVYIICETRYVFFRQGEIELIKLSTPSRITPGHTEGIVC